MRNRLRNWIRPHHEVEPALRWINTQPVTSSDVPCTIQSLTLTANVCGLYAEVAQTLVLHNPNKRDLSTEVTLPLPDRATVCGYALDIDGHMRDGVVVPKEQARVAFETEQRRGADPGLVEAVRGNVYRTRVYPVPAQGTRTIAVRYVAPLLVRDGMSATLDLPMPPERLKERSVHINVQMLDCPTPRVEGLGTTAFAAATHQWHTETIEHDVTPDAHIRLCLPELPLAFSLVQKDAEDTAWFCVSEVAPVIKPNLAPIPNLVVLWDTSGSRAGANLTAELKLLRAYSSWSTFTSFTLITFNNSVQEPRTFSTVKELLAYVKTLDYDGGTNFDALAQALATTYTRNGWDKSDAACVLFTDGLDTLQNKPFSLANTALVMAVASGAQRDVEALRQACGGCAFDLATAPQDAGAFISEICCPTRLRSVEGEGVAEVLGIGSGADGRFTVVGRLASENARLALDNGSSHELTSSDAPSGRTLSCAWAALRVAQLAPRSHDNADELLELGRRFGVVSPATSLLVLETLDQWLHYEIEPPTTWEHMHTQWKQAQEGLMRESSEEGRKAVHLRQLRKEWQRLLTWWESDEFPQEPQYDFPVAPQREGFYAGNTEARPRFMGAMVAREARACVVDASVNEEMAFEACAAPDPAAPSHADHSESVATATVAIRPWMPNTPYLNQLDRVASSGMDAAHKAYFSTRSSYATSPSFFLDCAGWFLSHGDKDFGLRVLTNLAELRIEDAALLRVMAWRLREAGELELALVTLRRVLRLRNEDSQSHRDLALVLGELAQRMFANGNESLAKDLVEEAGAQYRVTALTPWQRRPLAIGLFAVEEYNVLRAWSDKQAWQQTPELPLLDPELEGVPACDLRITLAWDADETDVDLHVTEPSGEEAYYAHRFTSSGGRVSEDITDGYGPELYSIRKAKSGTYRVRAHYYASHAQTIFGPATCTLTVYTNWGRPSQEQRITSTRLTDEHEMIEVGSASYEAASRTTEPAETSSRPRASTNAAKGMSLDQVSAIYGTPTYAEQHDEFATVTWQLPAERTLRATFVSDKLEHLVECMPWGEELIVV